MNKIYKVVWSRVKNCYVVVSEIVKNHCGGAGGQSAAAVRGCAVLLAVAALTGGYGIGPAQAATDPVGDVTHLHEDLKNGEDTNLVDAVNTVDDKAAAADTKADAAAAEAQKHTSVRGDSNVTVAKSSLPNAAGGAEYMVALNNEKITLGDTSHSVVIEGEQGNITATGIVTAGSVKVGGKTYITAAGLQANSQKITGVLAGTADTDAVNKKQLTEATKYVDVNATGTKATAAGTDAIAIGSSAVSNGKQAVAVGLQTAAAGDDSLALGNGASTDEDAAGAIAVGVQAAANAADAIALGNTAQAQSAGAVAMGAAAAATGENAVALGKSATAAANALAFGVSSSAGAAGSIAAGQGAVTTGDGDISIGKLAGLNSISGGGGDRQNRVSIGTEAGQNVSGNESVAIGYQAGKDVSGNFNIAIGSGAGSNTHGDNNTAIGYHANVTGSGSHSTAIGAETLAESGATALGDTASAAGENSIAVGYNASAAGSSGIAIGTSAHSTGKNIALGGGSQGIDADNTGTGYLTGAAAVPAHGVVSVGSSQGINQFQRRITNVADGANKYDAVNVNQLKAVQNSVANLVGGDVSLDANGSFSQIKFTSTTGHPYVFDTISEALAAFSNGTISTAPGEAVKYTDDTKNKINLGGTSYNTITGTGGTTINNVAKATNGDQAVNLDLLNNMIQEKKVKYFSVNSSEGGNRDNTAATGADAMAAGPAATAAGEKSISWGFNTKAEGNYSIVLGNASSTDNSTQVAVYGQSGIAIGTSASSRGVNSIAFGTWAETTPKTSDNHADNAIAIGYKAHSTADQGVAVGKGATASGVDSFAQGTQSSAAAKSSIAVGPAAAASGTASMAIGKNASASNESSLAIGVNASAAGYHSGLIGTAMSNADNPQASTLYGADTYAVGNGSGAIYGTNSSMMGNQNTVGAKISETSYHVTDTRILGNQNDVIAEESNIIGSGNTVGERNAESVAYAQNIGILGNHNTVSAERQDNKSDVFIVGNNVTATLGDSVYLGKGSSYTAKSDASAANEDYGSVMIGNGTYQFAGKGAVGIVTIGSTDGNRRLQNVSAGLVSAGSTDAVNGSQLYALTQPLRFGGDNSTIADTSQATVDDKNVIQRSSDQALKISGGAKENLSDNNIGVIADTNTNSLTVKLAKDLDLTADGSVTMGNTVVNASGVTIGTGNATVSLTADGLNNGSHKIINVAAGTADTDAVNVSQLNEVQTLAGKHTTMTVNGGTAAQENSYTDGNLQLEQTTTNGQIAYDVKLNDVITLGSEDNKKISLNGTTGMIQAGKVMVNGAAGTVNNLNNTIWDNANYVSGQAATEDQLKAVDDIAVKYDRNGDGTINKGSITLGDASGDTLQYTQIHNVANGEADQDAVNMSQLKDVQALAGKHTTMTANGGTAAPEGAYTDGNLRLKQTTINGQVEYDVKLNDKITLGDTEGKQIIIDGMAGNAAFGGAILGIQTVRGEEGSYLRGLSNTSFHIAEGAYQQYQGSNMAATEGQLYDAFDFLDKKIDNISIKNDDGNMDIDKNEDGGSGSTGTDPKPSPGFNINLKDNVTIGGGTGHDDKTKPGSVTVIGSEGKENISIDGSKGTVSGLSNTTWNRNDANKDAAEGGYKGSTNAATESQLQQAMEGTVQYDINKDGTVNTGSITLAGGSSGTAIHNVADGKISEDSKDAVNGSQLYATNQHVEENANNIQILGSSVNELDSRIDRVGAGAAALAALHPLDFDPDAKWDFAAGYGNYRGANAVSVGTYYRPNEDTMFSVGGSFGGGENMVNAGVSIKLGSVSNNVSTSRVAMAREIVELRGNVAQLTALVNQLIGSRNQNQSDLARVFPDVPKNHWAYEAIHQLAAQGIVEGYPDGTFGGGRTMTRYEFASLVYRALQTGVSVSGDVQRLVQEFRPELDLIRVDTIAKDRDGNATIQRVRVNQPQK